MANLNDVQQSDGGPAPCPYCSKPMEKPVTHRIIDRAWNEALRRQYVRTTDMKFCSDRCGSNYQMGCEG